MMHPRSITDPSFKTYKPCSKLTSPGQSPDFSSEAGNIREPPLLPQPQKGVAVNFCFTKMLT